MFYCYVVKVVRSERITPLASLFMCVYKTLFHVQYGTSTSGPQRYPKLIQNVSGKGMKQISAAVRHCVACDTNLPVKGESTITTPSAVPTQYSSLRGLSCDAIYTRLMLLNYFSKLVSKSWTLFSTMNKNKVTYKYST